MKATFILSAVFASLALASPAQTQPTVCKVDSDCKANEQCSKLSHCVLNKTTRDAPLAKLAQACHSNGDCEKGLLCEKDICVASKVKRDSPLSQLGQDCQASRDCVKGLVCDQQKKTCDAPNSHNKRGVSIFAINLQKRELTECRNRNLSPRWARIAKPPMIV